MKKIQILAHSSAKEDVVAALREGGVLHITEPSLELGETKTGRSCGFLHTFYEMADGSYLAFFEVPDSPYDFPEWHDFDLHIALEVDRDHMMNMFEKGKA